MTARSGAVRLAATAFLLLGTAGCDNIVKYVDVFATMVDGPATETYEAQPVPPPEGAVPVDGLSPSYALPVADTASALRNPLADGEEDPARGEELYTIYCAVCHGPEGTGRGPAVNWDGQQNPANDNRFPMVPALDLTSGTGPARSDGYIWGMIENGRGMMPSYRRIGERDRWHLIAYVRTLQGRAGGGSGGTGDAGGGSGPGGGGR